MAILKKIPKNSAKAQKKGYKRAYEYSNREKKFLKKVGLQVSYDLQNRFEEARPIEWLSWETSVSRSALREIIAGRSNPKVITLLAISEAFEYESLQDFLNEALS